MYDKTHYNNNNNNKKNAFAEAVKKKKKNFPQFVVINTVKGFGIVNKAASKTVGVSRGHQRAGRLKPQSQKTSQSDHRTTVLSNSMKPSHAVWGHPRQPVERCDRMWSQREKGMANHFSILALRSP